MSTVTIGRATRTTRALGPGVLGVAVIVCACASVAAIGGTISAPAVGLWYEGLPKPAWTPHEWVFGPVWTALFATMAVAASTVWLSRRCDDVCCPLSAFGVQLGLSLVWCVCFFGLRSPVLGFLDGCLLWVAVALTTAEFFLVSRTAGCLMALYWVWVTYAAALNGAILLLGG